MNWRRYRPGRAAKATLRWLFTVGALVNFTLAGTLWAEGSHLTSRLIAWGLFDLTVLFLFFDRENPPDPIVLLPVDPVADLPE